MRRNEVDHLSQDGHLTARWAGCSFFLFHNAYLVAGKRAPVQLFPIFYGMAVDLKPKPERSNCLMKERKCQESRVDPHEIKVLDSENVKNRELTPMKFSMGWLWI
jgi:hypothetical protein